MEQVGATDKWTLDSGVTTYWLEPTSSSSNILELQTRQNTCETDNSMIDANDNKCIDKYREY